MDDFFKHLSTTDTKKKLSVGQEIIDYLGDPETSIECEDMGAFVDALVPWMQSSNFRVSQNGLDIAGLLIDRLGSAFRPYLLTILNPSVDRLGDSRESVREKAHHVLASAMSEVAEPQYMFEKMAPAFAHKNANVRAEMLLMLQNTLNTHGSGSLQISKLIPGVVALVSDPTAPVRDAAQTTLVEVYRHVGERLRMDLQKKYTVPPAKMNVLMQRFDQVRHSGDMMPTATLSIGTTNDGTRGGDDETDRHSGKSSSSAKSRSSSVPAGVRRPGSFAIPKQPAGDGTSAASSRTSTASSGVRRNPSMRLGSTSSASGAGAVDEDSFIQAFEDVKRVNIFSPRALTDEINKIKETLSKSSNDWKVRIDALQMVRSLMIAGAASYDEFFTSLRTLDSPFQVSVKDLRSQVVREACITIAYMSQQLTHKVDRFLEILLQNLINLIMNSAKVMSTSGIVCIRFIIQNTYSTRFVPIITSNLSSKSRDIRRHSCEFLDQLLHTWPTHAIEKHVLLVQEAIKKGIGDADPDARQLARKAYWGFADHFKSHADQLLQSLDSTHRRLLQAGNGDMSNSSSSNSLNMTGRGGVTSTMPRSRQHSVTSSRENLVDGSDKRSSTLTRKNSGIPMYTSPLKTASPYSFSNGGGSPSPSAMMMASATPGSGRTGMSARSNSAIDPSAVRRASVRAQYAQRSRMNAPVAAGNTGTLGSRSRRSSTDKAFSNVPSSGYGTPDNRNGRSRSRVGSGIVHSQPGSRSTSPSSLRSYQTYYDSPAGGNSTLGRRRSSGIPRSTTSSRDPSPNRFGATTPTSGTKFRAMGGPGRPSYGGMGVSPGGGGGDKLPPKRPLMTENILRQSREAESALADALKHSPDRKRAGGRMGGNGHSNNGHIPFDDGSDESEASSISSVGAGHVQHGHAHQQRGGPSPMKPRYIQQSPNPAPYRAQPHNNGRGVMDPVDDSENLNPDFDIHKSLRNTANAIQNYSFDSSPQGGASATAGGGVREGKFKLDLSASGQPTLEEKMSLLDMSSGGSNHRGGRNGSGDGSRYNDNSQKDPSFSDDEDNAAIQDIMETLALVKTQSKPAERRTCMTQLIRMTREGKTGVIQENFRAILRLLLENLSDEVGATRALVYGVLSEMLKQEQMISSFQAFTELIILKVLEAHRDEEKDVERAAEACAASMALVLPPDIVIRVLNPIIKTGDFPVNQAAIKMLTKVADHERSREVVVTTLDEIMPGLLKAYDNVESSVRKAAVFCMVSMHQQVGDDLQPHLESLNGSKLKLLNLYIKRAQAQKEQSAPVSPRLATPH